MSDSDMYGAYIMQMSGGRRIRNPLNQYDPNNITGAQLAEVGRFALAHKRFAEVEIQEGERLEEENKRLKIKLSPNADINWLHERVEEVCRKGRL